MNKNLYTIFYLIILILILNNLSAQDNSCDQGCHRGWQGKLLFWMTGGDKNICIGSYEKTSDAGADPNEIIGPEGYSQSRMISSEMHMPYTILYENDPEFATASAQVVQITQAFAPLTDLSTFELGNFGFGDYIFEVPPGLNHYQTRLDLRDSLNIFVNVTAGIDIINQQFFWVFESIDPNTGQLPQSTDAGFLPVNDTLIHNGEGFVSYKIRPLPTVQTGDSIVAKASIIFDTNEAIETNTTFNVIDAIAPVSAVNSEYQVVNDSLQLSWIATDDEGGSGVASVDIYDCNDDGIYEIIAHQVKQSPVIMPFISSHDHRFFAIASDNVGNQEAMKALPDVRILEEGKNHAPFLIEPFNDVVLLKNTESAILVEDIEKHFMDEDGENLSYAVCSSISGLDSICIDNNKLKVYPTSDFVKDIVLEITAQDASKALASGTLMLSFREINHAPQLMVALKDTIAYVGHQFAFKVPDNTFADEDSGDHLSYTVGLANGQDLPEWITFSEKELLFSGNPSNQNIGVDTIQIVASDPFYLTATDQFIITVQQKVEISEISIIGNKVKLFPNPAMHTLNIEFREPLVDDLQMKMIDLSGNIVCSKILNSANQFIDIRNLYSGVYVIIFLNETECLKVKFVKY